jgi:hypothetical protein
MELRGEYLHDSQAERIGLPPIESRRKSNAVVANTEAYPALLTATKRHGYFTVGAVGEGVL